ncbi:MAG: hypothetical protein ACOCZC_03120 [Halodesulfurarchaeum sp.]
MVRLLTEAPDRDWNETSDVASNESLLFSDNETYENHTHSNETLANDTIANDTIANGSKGESYTNPTQIPWIRATGAVRFAYIDPGEDEPYWTTETLQVEDGDYYGSRVHIRMYEAPNPDDEWLAMQAHTEHFDWFTLRHRVDGDRAAQARVETDLMSASQVDHQEDITRIYLANDGGTDFDGWVTIVDIGAGMVAPMLFMLAIGARTRRRVDEFLDRYVTSTGRVRLAEARRRFTGSHCPRSIRVWSSNAAPRKRTSKR